MLSWMQLARKIEGASRTSEKARLFADALRAADEVDLEVICRLLGSRGTAQAGAVSWPALAKAVEEVAGAPAGSLAKILDETGDIGLAVEELLESERPIAGEAAASEERHAQVRSSAIASATGVMPVTGEDSAPTLRSLPESFAAIRGASGQRRHDLLMQLFYGTSPIAAKYIVRMLSGDVQIGLRDGLLEGAIAAAFGAEVSAVRWAMTLEGDAGRVALLAKRGALAEAKLRYFHPIPAMLAAPAASAADALERLSEIAAGSIAAEDKYDGIRAQLHLADGQVQLFGRDANDITVAFPEIAAAASLLSSSLILDGEIIAFEEGHPLPVHAVQSRLRGTETTLHERERISVQFIAFDLIAHGDQLLISAPLHERHTALVRLGIKEQCSGVIHVAPQRVVAGIEEIEAEFIAARMRGSEGIVLKSTTAAYAPGRRGSAWLKLKHPIDSVDCVVVGVEYGVGRRRTLLSELTFAVRDDLSGRLTTLGRASAQLGEREMSEMGRWFEAHTVAQLGNYRSVEPRIVVEVSFDELRRSERSGSGYSLRGARIVRFRTDLGPDQVASLSAIEARCRASTGSTGETE
jgi:DNA ligase-1